MLYSVYVEIVIYVAGHLFGFSRLKAYSINRIHKSRTSALISKHVAYILPQLFYFHYRKQSKQRVCSKYLQSDAVRRSKNSYGISFVSIFLLFEATLFYRFLNKSFASMERISFLKQELSPFT